MTQIERMLMASRRLAEPARTLFSALYEQGLNEEQVAHKLGMDAQTFQRSHVEMLRSLRTASAA
jgi:hypothetical protein